MRTHLLFIFISILFFTSCSKKDTSNNPPPTQVSYLNSNFGSTWNYNTNDSSGAAPKSADYTVTSSSKDTSINSRSYHVYTYSYGGSQYLNISGHDYYQFDSLPGGLQAGVFERLYLKDDMAVGGSWSQNLNITVNVSGLPLQVPLTITNTITEKGISRTVNNINYSNVIHVTTSISSSLIPGTALTSSIDSYYAQKYGLIENTSKINLNYLGISQNVNTQTKLVSSNLK
ncbi:MAG: hypothetical protein M3Z26_12235 [Bacteroidota bacterium]|nr:hypothetical protein [Bacteroidota bacterium]